MIYNLDGDVKLSILTVTIHPAIDKAINLPRLRANEMVRAHVDLVYAGGKGNNVARALTRLGVPVIACGFQGGYSGKFITQQMKAEGIVTDFVFCEAPTRITLLIREEQAGNVYAIYEPGQEVQAKEIKALKQTYLRLLDDCQLCLLCGSAQTPTTENIFYEFIELAKERGVRCGLDSSGKALSLGIRAQPYMVKVNVEELEEHFNRKLSNIEQQTAAIKELQAGGITIVALSRGSQGVVVTNGGQVWEGVLRMDRVVNMMGCGDSLLAGIAAGIVSGATVPEIIRLGIACGAANTQSIGAGFINPILVSKLKTKVKVKEVIL